MASLYACLFVCQSPTFYLFKLPRLLACSVGSFHLRPSPTSPALPAVYCAESLQLSCCLQKMTLTHTHKHAESPEAKGIPNELDIEGGHFHETSYVKEQARPGV